jgi:aldehyde dehydrogenase (NAD+)
MPSHERGKRLIALAEALEANIDELAAIESLDNGKAFAIAKGFDVAEAAATLRYYGGWADKITGQTIETNDSKFGYTRHEPIGVVGQIIPWNFPIYMLSWKLGPALAAGNTIVLKTAEQTPLSALKVAELAQKIFPPGVINIISGFGAIAGAAIANVRVSPRLPLYHPSSHTFSLSTAHEDRKGRFHRLHPHRPDHPQGFRQLQPQEGHPRARWQVSQHCL